MGKARIDLIAWLPLFVLCLSLSGGVISTSVTCGITNNDPHNHHSETQTSTSSCSLVDLKQSALSSTGSVSAGPFFVNLQGTEYAGGPYSDGAFLWSNSADLYETASYTATILADGRVRDGFVDLSVALGGGSSPFNGANAGVIFGQNFGVSEDRHGACQSSFNFRCRGEFLVPITLGVPIVVRVYGNVFAPLNGAVDGSYGVSLSANLSFTFLELDQRSQVGWTDITAAPEPSAAWLSVFGIAFIAIRKLFTVRKA